jgi:ferredoxin
LTYKILEFCVKCGGCLYECPSGAIIEGETQYYIDQAKCTNCGRCLTENHCPAWAITKVEDPKL